MGNDDKKDWQFKQEFAAPQQDLPNLVASSPDTSLAAGLDEAGGEDDPKEEHLPPGTVINNRYMIINRIGAGGMGTVYRVLDQIDQKAYALKMISPEMARQNIRAKRLKQEVQATTILSHPHIVAVHNVGTMENGAPFFVMDCIEGTSLECVLTNHKLIDRPRALDIFIQIADALRHAHSKGIVHRDLKPANVLLTQDELAGDFVKLVDFGIAKIEDLNAGQTKLTQTGELVGSPIYMSPEQCRGYPVDGRSDIYSLGCIMYEVLAGKVPFDGENAMAVLLMHVMESAKPLTQDPNDALSHVVMRCLEKEPCDRYADASALLADLTAIQDSRPVQVRPKKRKADTGKLGKIALGIASSILLAGVIVSAFFAGNRLATPENTPATFPYWESLDWEGQQKMNVGKYPAAIELFRKAEISPSATTARQKMSLRKLAVAYHITGNTPKEQEIDSQIDFNSGKERTPRAPKPSPSPSTNGATRRQNADDFDAPVRKRSEPAPFITANTVNNVLRAMPALTDSNRAQVESVADDVLIAMAATKDRVDQKATVAFLEASIPELQRLLGKDSLTCQRIKDLYVDALLHQGALQQAMVPAWESVQFYQRKPEWAAFGRDNSFLRMAEMYNQTDSPKKAEELAQAVIKLQLQTPDKSPLKLIRAKTAYTSALVQQQNLEAAEPQLKDLIKEARAADDAEHLQQALTSLAFIYELKNDFPKAEALLTGALAQEQTKPSLTTAAIQQSLGELYFRQPLNKNLWRKAEPYFVQALQTRQRLLYPESMSLQASLHAVINFDLLSGRLVQPERSTRALLTQLMAIEERMEAPVAERAKVYAQLAFILDQEGNRADATRLVKQVLQMASQDSSVSDAFDERFYLLVANADVMDSVKEIMAKRLEKYHYPGMRNSLDFAQALDDLGHVYFKQGNLDQAGKMIDQAATIVIKLSPFKLTPAERWQAADIVQNRAIYLKHTGSPEWEHYQGLSDGIRYYHSAK